MHQHPAERRTSHVHSDYFYAWMQAYNFDLFSNEQSIKNLLHARNSLQRTVQAHEGARLHHLPLRQVNVSVTRGRYHSELFQQVFPQGVERRRAGRILVLCGVGWDGMKRK